MIEYILPRITDSTDYLTALSLFRANVPMTKDEVDQMLSIYAKYQPEDSDDYLKICMAVDMLPGRTVADMADFEPLELGTATLDALFTSQKIISGQWNLTSDNADHITEQVLDEDVSMPARVLLARVALDTMTTSREFTSMRAQIAVLAEFLTSIGAETLDRYTALVVEVKLKCRM